MSELMAAKAELPGILELVKPLGALRGEASAIEERVREMPEQYFWAHKRFKTRPPGEPSPYRRK